MGSLPLSDLSDEDLLLQLSSGVEEALGVLFERHYRQLFSTAHRILRDIGETEDLLQEVFLDIYRDSRKFDASRGSVKAWVQQCTFNRSLNRLRYLKVRGHYGDRTQNSPEVGHAPRFPDYPHFIRRNLNQLTDNERHVIEGVWFEGLLLKEIAERSGQPLANVRNFYYRGIRKLRSILETKSAGASGSG
jgi:RNA polymerase sigma-70 factor (ECF subfamily)